jgi:micrococcal nuclease
MGGYRRALLILAITLTPFIPGCVDGASQGVQPAATPTPDINDSVAAHETGGGRIKAIVTRVIDGDTIEVNAGGAAFKLRYIGMDSPELDSVDTNTRNIAVEAADKNRELVGGKTVELENDVSETDRYGRLLRYVYVNGMMVNAELVRLGYAQAVSYPPDIKYQNMFSELQAAARAAKAGIWGPASFGPAPGPVTKGLYLGSKMSNKYHSPSCVWAKRISAGNAIWFVSSEEAHSKGYVPCRVCNPPQ